jgi:hypothetical protein
MPDAQATNPSLTLSQEALLGPNKDNKDTSNKDNKDNKDNKENNVNPNKVKIFFRSYFDLHGWWKECRESIAEVHNLSSFRVLVAKMVESVIVQAMILIMVILDSIIFLMSVCYYYFSSNIYQQKISVF